MPQIHLRAEADDYAPLVLLPGDPNRATWIAEKFDGGPGAARQVTSHRGLLGYTGTYNGVPVSVQTSGMGAPSMSIVVEELLRLGARRLIRVGTCGGIGPGIKTGEIVIAASAAPVDGATRTYLHGDAYAPTADFGLVRALVEAAERRGQKPHVGQVATVDVFYNPDPDYFSKWREPGRPRLRDGDLGSVLPGVPGEGGRRGRGRGHDPHRERRALRRGHLRGVLPAARRAEPVDRADGRDRPRSRDFGLMAAASGPGRADGRDLGRSTAFGPELALAIELAHQAGRIQMDRYERLERVEAKGPRDVVTEVDHLCEALVMEAVRARYPDDAFYAEEIGEVAAAGEAKSGRVWIVDPLDGTINYANGIPFFCISIALVADGRPVVGRRLRPHARRDLRELDRRTVAAKRRADSSRPTRSCSRTWSSRSPSGDVAPCASGARLSRASGPTDRWARAALTLAYVACGRFDVYAQGAGISAWDVAAAGLIAERAGATVTSLDGGPWFDLARPARKWSCLAAAPGPPRRDAGRC